ncbi:MAG TPA: peptidyl-prolyl cis-trans isomerase [Vicinamibacterales bacterium]|nr:peptidyl-prolyl cis-trans isomerase [Vicinamibacterales bacterium]
MTMLDRMRRHRGWLKWSLGLVAVTMVIFFIPQDYLRPTTTVGAAPSETIAEVEGRSLTAGDFQQRYLQQIQQYRNQFGGSINAQLLRQLGVDQQVLTQMIDEQVALIEADRHGIRVSDEELAQQIFAIPAFQENGRFIGEQRYEQLLQSQNPPLTKSQFEESLRRSLVLDKLRSAITSWIAVSDSEVENEFRRRNEKVKVQVVALTADKFRSQVTVTDAEIAPYFESHKADYRVGEQRKVKYLLLDREQARQTVAVPQADIQRYYNDNSQQYTTPERVRASHILLNTGGKDEAAVRKQAEELLAKIKAGANFAELAKKYSEDPGSKEKGGDLDFFPRGQMVPEFEQAAFSLQPGQVSELVKTQYGFHIIKVVEKQAGSTQTLDQVRAQIQQTLAAQIADRQITDRARQLAEKIKTADDLNKAAAENGLKVEESGFFQRTEPVPGLGSAPQVADAAFQLKDGAASEPLASTRGPVFITVSGKKDAYTPTLDEVKDRVREDLIRSKATELSRQRASAIAAQLKGAKDFAAAAKAQGFEAKDSQLVARDSALPDVGVNPEVDKVAFTLPTGGVSDPIQTNDATVIVRVAERDDVTPDEMKLGRERFRAELLNERRGRFFASFMTKAKEKLKIDVKADVMRRLMDAQQV